eukprot:gnl/Spiro4/13344_TR7100_c0_g1_i1.p1 gnl/Spiro4/13344_TR7100_c0_g1~~gnl/Spiro4/13344_TR7100_c0_g1_i1.p1  ORF type:complete len:354 (-),score=64.11 gnl/Spiro4/13344_TR7100_c0_g1_i1:14-1075(-)
MLRGHRSFVLYLFILCSSFLCFCHATHTIGVMGLSPDDGLLATQKLHDAIRLAGSEGSIEVVLHETPLLSTLSQAAHLHMALGRSVEVASALTHATRMLRQAGAHIIVIPRTDALHPAFLAHVAPSAQAHWLHTATEVGKAASKLGLTRLGIIGTKLAMGSSSGSGSDSSGSGPASGSPGSSEGVFDVLHGGALVDAASGHSAARLEIMLPSAEDMVFIDNALLPENVHLLKESATVAKQPNTNGAVAVAARIKATMRDLRSRGCDGVVLAAPELSWLFPSSNHSALGSELRLSVLDTTDVLVSAAVQLIASKSHGGADPLDRFLSWAKQLFLPSANFTQSETLKSRGSSGAK